MKRLIQVSLYDTSSQSSCHDTNWNGRHTGTANCASPADLGYESTRSLSLVSREKVNDRDTSLRLSCLIPFRFCRVDLQRPDMHIRSRRRLFFTTRSFLPRLSLTASYATSFVRTALGYAQRTANIASTTCCPCWSTRHTRWGDDTSQARTEWSMLRRHS